MGHPVGDVDLCATTPKRGGLADLALVHFPVTLARSRALLAVWPDLHTGSPRPHANPRFQVYSRGAGADRCADHSGARSAGCFAVHSEVGAPVGRLRDFGWQPAGTVAGLRCD